MATSGSQFSPIVWFGPKEEKSNKKICSAYWLFCMDMQCAHPRDWKDYVEEIWNSEEKKCEELRQIYRDLHTDLKKVPSTK